MSKASAAHDRGRLCEIARHAAVAAAEVALQYAPGPGRPIPVDRKANDTPVTVADREAEAVIREILRRETPEFGQFGEEYGQEGDERDRWIIDPIDGTQNFIRGLDSWATLIALECDGTVQLGVVHQPTTGTTWYATRNGGAYVAYPSEARPTALRTSGIATIPEAAMAHGSLGAFSDEPGTPIPWEALQQVAAIADYTRGLGDWLGHMLVAEGRLDIMLDPIVAIWDVAPVQCIVTEAGGYFGDRAGAPRIDAGHAISAASPALHAAIRALLR